MAEYRGKSRRIKNALMEIVSDIKYDSGHGDENAFLLVTDSTQDEFDGYPILQVLPDAPSNEKAAMGQNDRGINLVLRTHVPLEGESPAGSPTIDKIYDLTDLILDTLDSADFDNRLNEIDPSLGTWILDANRGVWIPIQTSAGVVMSCDINVEVKYSKDL